VEPSVDTALRWIVLLPLLGAAINGLLNRRLPRRLVGLIACGSVGLSFVLTVRLFLRLKDLPVAERLITDSLYTWLGFGALTVDLGFASVS